MENWCTVTSTGDMQRLYKQREEEWQSRYITRSHQLHGERERNKIFAKFCTRLGDPHVRLYEEDPLMIDLCLKEICPFQ